MFEPLIRVWNAAALFVSALAIAPSSAQTGHDSAGPVTVGVNVALAANTSPSQTMAAMSDMRAMMMKGQPGYFSEASLQNLNASTAPRYVHVS